MAPRWPGLALVASCALLARPAEADGTGALTVCVLEARDLLMLDPTQDAHHKGHTYDDPKPVLQVGSHVCSLDTRHSQHPTWRQCCYFGHQPSDALVSIRIVDKDAVVDDLCGVASTAAGNAGVHWLPLERLGSSAGEVKVEVGFEADSHLARASLSQLRVFAGASRGPALPLQPPFRPEIYEYTLAVDEEVETVGVEAVAAEVCGRGGACEAPRVEVRAGRQDAPTPSDFIPLSMGRNTLHVVVQPGAEQRAAQRRTYVLHVHRSAPDDAALQLLEVDGVRLVPPFAAERLSYSAVVPHGTERVTVHARTRSAFASINGQVLGARDASDAWALHVGTNLLRLLVLAQDGVTRRQYELTLAREAELGAVPLLEGLRVEPVGGGEVTARARRAAEHALRFEAHVSADVDAVTVSPRWSAAAGPAGALRVNSHPAAEAAAEHWPLQPGRNLIQLLVWREGHEAERQLYTLLLTRDADARAARSPLAIPFPAPLHERGARGGARGGGARAALLVLALLGVLAALAYLCVLRSTRLRLLLVDRLLPREGAGSLRSSLWQLAPFTKLEDDDDERPPPSYPRSPARAQHWRADEGEEAGTGGARAGRRAAPDGELEMGMRTQPPSAGGTAKVDGAGAPSAQPRAHAKAGPSPLDGSGSGSGHANPFLPAEPPATGAAAVWHESSTASAEVYAQGQAPPAHPADGSSAAAMPHSEPVHAPSSSGMEAGSGDDGTAARAGAADEHSSMPTMSSPPYAGLQ